MCCAFVLFFFLVPRLLWFSFFFFFNDTATTEIYTLSLHDALPISAGQLPSLLLMPIAGGLSDRWSRHRILIITQSLADRKSTRLNSSHGYISYAVFCLKKKKKINDPIELQVRAHCI